MVVYSPIDLRCLFYNENSQLIKYRIIVRTQYSE